MLIKKDGIDMSFL